jgi:hypothetical protein
MEAWTPNGRLAEPLKPNLCGTSNPERLSTRSSSVPTRGVFRRFDVATLEPIDIRSSTWAWVYDPLNEIPPENDFCSCTVHNVERSSLLFR